jgi:hypothetical protein
VGAFDAPLHPARTIPQRPPPRLNLTRIRRRTDLVVPLVRATAGHAFVLASHAMGSSGSIARRRAPTLIGFVSETRGTQRIAMAATIDKPLRDF